VAGRFFDREIDNSTWSGKERHELSASFLKNCHDKSGNRVAGHCGR
jgi:hypothetical protein